MSDATFKPEEWARTFLRDLLERWLKSSSTATGIFHPYLDRSWHKKEAGSCTLVSQCRLVYNFSRAYSLFGELEFSEAARAGLQALEDFFLLPAEGYRWSVTIDGKEIDASPDSYGHAFCILAQAAAAKSLSDDQLTERAMKTWRFVSRTFPDDRGGLRWRIDGAREWEQTSRSQNPLMHMFEALIALAVVDRSGMALEDASSLLAFIRTLSNYSKGALLEGHTVEWKAPSSDPIIDLGHQFEWAFLLSEWHRLSGDPNALQEGHAFLETGLKWGLTEEGGVRASCDPKGKVISGTNGLWEECEAIRAISRYATRHGRNDLRPALSGALAFYRERFVDSEYGGVFASLDGEGRPGADDKGNPWKLDYHTTNMCLELMGETS
jgi:mannose-6-phosphate isomerase